MGTKKRAQSTPPTPARPAGMQHMGQQLYELIRAAISEQAAPAVERPA